MDLARRKKIILDEYLPDLSTKQEICFSIPPIGSDEKTTTRVDFTEEMVKPRAHFRGSDNEEYFVFYNTDIFGLLIVLLSILKREILHDDSISSGLRGRFRRIIDSPENCWKIEGKLVESVLRKTPGWVYWVPVVNLALALAEEPNEAIQRREFESMPSHVKMHVRIYDKLRDIYGTYAKQGAICAVVLDRGLNKLPTLRKTPADRYQEVEKTFSCIAARDKKPFDTVNAMDKALDTFEGTIRPMASDDRSIDFCFCLNEASSRLSKYEDPGLMQHAGFPTVQAMDRLRRKIDLHLIHYRFVYERNASPILGIKIDRCKVVAETKENTLVFIDRSQTRSFQKALQTVLDNKATNIARKYSLDSFSGSELRKLAESLDPDSHDDMIMKMKNEIADMKADANKNECEGKCCFVNAGLKIVIEGTKIAVALMADGSKSYELSRSQLEDFVNSSSKEKTKDKTPESDGKTDEKKKVEEKEGEGAKDEMKKDEEKEGEGEKDEDEKGEDGKENEGSASDEPTTAVGKALDEMNVTGFMEDIAKGCKCIVESMRLRERAEILQEACKKLEVKQSYMIEFINVLKLYNQIVKGSYGERENFEGVLIEEERKPEVKGGSKLLRSYSVKELSPLDTKQDHFSLQLRESSSKSSSIPTGHTDAFHGGAMYDKERNQIVSVSRASNKCHDVFFTHLAGPEKGNTTCSKDIIPFQAYYRFPIYDGDRFVYFCETSVCEEKGRRFGRLDLRTVTFEELPCLPSTPFKMFAEAMAGCYHFGGVYMADQSSQLVCYDVGKKTWSRCGIELPLHNKNQWGRLLNDPRDENHLYFLGVEKESNLYQIDLRKRTCEILSPLPSAGDQFEAILVRADPGSDEFYIIASMADYSWHMYSSETNLWISLPNWKKMDYPHIRGNIVYVPSYKSFYYHCGGSSTWEIVRLK